MISALVVTVSSDFSRGDEYAAYVACQHEVAGELVVSNEDFPPMSGITWRRTGDKSYLMADYVDYVFLYDDAWIRHNWTCSAVHQPDDTWVVWVTV
jgi:hypothetical protein